MATTGKMKAQKSSKVVKPKKGKRPSTATHKNHRFQPFSERIANLKIDPIRQRRKPEDREELSSGTATYFGRSLEEWRDLNLSHTFSTFVKEASPLCDNLPVVLHNEEKLMDLLVAYVEKGDGLSLEPLLNLLSHFAHDLDARFEKHFQRAVVTVAAVAAKHSDPAVVEWSFNCLAWLFKYLSRLLVPDLRPLYDVMAPYLGKESQKPFIIRFAAESMSFLIRKAAAAYERQQGPLDLIIAHIFRDYQDSADAAHASLYQQGVLTLLTESIKGVQNGMHSGGISILRSMLKHVEQQSEDHGEACGEIVVGALTSLIHYANAETFQPIQETVVQHISNSTSATRPIMASELIFTISTVRKGTRINDWRPLVSCLQTLITRAQQVEHVDYRARWSLLSAVAVVFQTSTVDVILPALGIFEVFRQDEWAAYFLQFCDLFARLGAERFQTFLLPQFRKFVVEQFAGYEDPILALLPRLASQGQSIQLTCPDALQRYIVHQFKDLNQNSRGVASSDQLASANIALPAVPYINMKETVCRELNAKLVSIVRTSLTSENAGCTEVDDFALCTCFGCLLDCSDSDSVTHDLWPLLCNKSLRFLRLEKFWSNLVRFIELSPPLKLSMDSSHITVLEEALLQCLSLPSHAIRQSALDVVHSLSKLRGQPCPSALETALAIESTPISLETSRSISMNIRRLSSGYIASKPDPFMRKATATYCLGLLHLQLSQAWEDAANTLAEISKTTDGEETIMNLAQRWLDGHAPDSELDRRGPVASHTILDSGSDGFQVASDFECSNLAKVQAISEQVFEVTDSGHPTMQEQLRLDHVRVPLISTTSREQALKVLSKIPSLAEKRSRMLVPVLLRWAGNEIAEASEEERAGATNRWNRKDQKVMLNIFAQFTNPKMLFKSGETYAALLNLCTNGDVEIQRSALKAIFAWKNSAINQYEERLTNLLDEARFRDELSVFVQSTADDGDEAAIQSEHLPELMPVLLRLLYGRAVAGGKHEQGSRRKAIFVALSRFDENVLAMFVDIALGSTSNVDLVDGKTTFEQSLLGLTLPPRQQLGMLNMLDDMLETLGSRLEPFGEKLLNTALLCSVAASRQLESSGSVESLSNLSLLRSTRQAGIQCLVKIFQTMLGLETSACAKIVTEELLVPRLEKFASENTQGTSGILRLLATWAASSNTQRYLVDFHGGIPESIAGLLREPTAKDDVRLFVLQEILDKLLLNVADIVLSGSHITAFVRSVGSVLHQEPSKPVLDACVASLTMLARHVHDQPEADTLVEVCSEMLTRPSRSVSYPTKTALLRTILPLVETFDIPATSRLYDAVCGLFSRLQGQQSRQLLSIVLFKLCQKDDKLLESAEICHNLNALSSRLDEADLQQREIGFTKIYEQHHCLSYQQWQPIVHNCLFCLRDGDDMVNRTSASRALERVIDAAAQNAEEIKPLISSAVLPAFVYGLKSSSELVRAEHLRLVGHLTLRFPEWPAVKDMNVLIVDGDDEASFFTNVLHIQQHRRLRALRRLSDEASHLSSNNVVQIFIPLLEHFVFDPVEGDSGRTLADQAVSTLGALSRVLSWSAFRTTFKRYASYLKSDEKDERTILRLLGALVEALKSTEKKTESMVSGKDDSRRSDVVIRDFLPPLVDYLHLKDESTVDRRMPVAVTVIKLLIVLPEAEMSARLPPVLTDVCQILRSRSQEARDQTRKTMGDIFALVGPSYLSFILKELRSALQRGYQLHVLSFTVHSLLVNSTARYRPGDLDGCVGELMSIVMDDIFGVTGQEKDAEEYKSGMKEVKSSKSFDTMELLASVTPIHSLGRLLRPLQGLLSERLDEKTIQKIDNLLTRLRKGIDQNPAADSRDMLTFCHEIARNVHSEPINSTKRLAETKFNRYLIQPEPHKKSNAKGSASTQSFKLASFALDLLRKVLRRHEDLMTPSNLVGFLPIAGDALVQGQEEVRLSAVRLLSTIMKVPLAQLETNATIYAKEAVRLIKTAPSLTTDSAKAGLELVTSVLREKRSADVQEKDLADVLKALKSDLDEPDRQGIIYKFLRAIIGRKVIMTEVYETMDQVGKVLVMNPDRNVREGARSAYLQFILEYPQGNDRWRKQSAYLVENLKYEHPAGRQSVMELLHQLLAKLPDDTLAQAGFTLFVALVPVHAFDSDQPCRQMAGLLIAKLFERAGDEQMDQYLKLIDNWLQNETSTTIQVAALLCWIVLLRAKAPSTRRIEDLRKEIDRLLNAVKTATSDSQSLLTKTTLQTFETLLETAPAVAFAKQSSGIWSSLRGCLLEPQTEGGETAAKLLGSYFSDLARTNAKTEAGLSSLPLRGSGGLESGKNETRAICSASLRVLRSLANDHSETHAGQTVRNLVFLGRCFSANGMSWREDSDAASDDDEGIQEDEKNVHRDSSALGYLFNRLSYIVRQESISVSARTASIQCQAAMVNVVETIPNLQSVLLPLYSLTDSSITQPQGEAYKNLVDKARELLDTLQAQVGTEAYISALSAVRSKAKARREERRTKRRIEAVSAPEKWARDKRKKYEVKKSKSKLRGIEARGKRRGW